MKIKRTLFIGHRQYCSLTFFILVNCGRRKESYFIHMGKEISSLFFFWGGVSEEILWSRGKGGKGSRFIFLVFNIEAAVTLACPIIGEKDNWPTLDLVSRLCVTYATSVATI